MAKTFLTQDILKINEEISQIENILKETMGFCNEDDIDDMDDMENPEIDNASEMGYEDNEPGIEETGAVDSYIDHIRKYSLNGLSALCDNPESEEYQMLKKIFQMCDKKPEKKEGMNESHRLFGILKENKKVVFEAFVNNTKNFNNLKRVLTSEAITKGYKPSDIRLVSENKIIV